MNGKIGVAPPPCGHSGEHVIGTYVKCLAGCDDAKRPVVGAAPETTPLPRIFRLFWDDGSLAYEQPWDGKSLITTPKATSAGTVVSWNAYNAERQMHWADDCVPVLHWDQNSTIRIELELPGV